MTKAEFKQKFNKQLNLDNKDWDFPQFAVAGYKSAVHPFHIRISLKDEINRDFLYYSKGNTLYELNLKKHIQSFLNLQTRVQLGITNFEKGNLKALQIPSAYLTKIIIDETSNKEYFNNVGFPVKDDIVKEIDSYLKDDTQIPINQLIGETFDLVEIDDFVNCLTYPVDKYNIDLSCKSITNAINLVNQQQLAKPENKIAEFDFDTIVSNRLSYIKELMTVKSLEYRRNANPFHNFDVGSAFTGECREKVLWGFLLKHLISLQDIVTDINTIGKLPSKEALAEKISDTILYSVLLEASIEEKRK